MKRPSFQFYPADWRNNANLRRCSWEARGVWIEVMGLMHDSDQYGVLRWTIKEIAQALGAPVKAVSELVTKSVMKGCDSGVCEPMIYTPRSGRKDGEPVTLIDAQEGPVWFASRMVRDEYVRATRGENTKFGEAPKHPPKHSPIPPFGEGQGDGSTSSSTSSTISSLRSEIDAPKSPRTSRPKKEDCTLSTYLATCKAEGRKPLPADHPIRAYCQDAGIADEMLQVAWIVFRDDYATGKNKAKRQKDWPAHFANSVKRRWYQLWFTNADGAAEWTSNGMQEKKVIEARLAQKETHE